MSKNGAQYGFSSVDDFRTVRRRSSYIFTALLLVCLTCWLRVNSPLHLLQPWQTTTTSPQDETGLSQHEFRWADIIPNRTLTYHPCFGGPYQCARLAVPLNWNASADIRDGGPEAAIAIIKLPAKVPVTNPRHGGLVVTNPGGPGESGVLQLLLDGKHIQTVLDAPDEDGGKYFDILAFDPRGVNNTTPSVRCFPDAFNMQTWLMRGLDYGLLWDSESVTAFEWARADAFGASCSADHGDGEVLPYINTAQVVEDMVEIIEQEGKRTAAEAKVLSEAEEILERTAYLPGQEQLQYWGFSYGTTIGSTFAAMHPDRVRRVVLDGNMDPADHYGGLIQEHSLQDADGIVAAHSNYCFQAGAAKCPLYNTTSPQDIEARLTSILTSFKSSPLAIPLPGTLGPELITYQDLHLQLLGALYFPFALAEQLWSLLAILETRNTTHPRLIALAKGKQATLQPASTAQSCDPTSGGGDPNSCLPYHAWAGAFTTVTCMDAGNPQLTREAFDNHRATLTNQSRWVSTSWARSQLACNGITALPAWRPALTFETQAWADPAHPLLLIGNTHDTVTPLANAQRIARDLFPGNSVVLQHDAEGHCSHATPSLCTAKAVRAYFQTGELPTAGTVCAPEKKPFLGCVKHGGCEFEGEDAKLWEALVELADTYGFSKKHGKDEDGEEVVMDAWTVYRRIIKM